MDEECLLIYAPKVNYILDIESFLDKSHGWKKVLQMAGGHLKAM